MTIRIDTHINEGFGEYFISKNTALKRTLHLSGVCSLQKFMGYVWNKQNLGRTTGMISSDV